MIRSRKRFKEIALKLKMPRDQYLAFADMLDELAIEPAISSQQVLTDPEKPPKWIIELLFEHNDRSLSVGIIEYDGGYWALPCSVSFLKKEVDNLFHGRYE